ncbi:MAG: hypothetical protein ACRDXX_10190, partial [Stackebrandtia sp.]
AMCGVGLALATRALDPPATDSEEGVVRDGSLVVAARHAGLVVGLLVIAPILDNSLQDAQDDAVEAGTAVVLDADASLADKAAIAVSLGEQLDEQPRSEFPDLEAAAARSDVDSETAEAVGGQLTNEIEAIFTRSFRAPFAAAAILTAATAVFLVAVRRRSEPTRHTRPALIGLAAVLLAGGGVLTAEVALGAADYGEHRPADPCAPTVDDEPASGFDAVTQRIAMSALNGAACELGVTREQVVLLLVGRGGPGMPERDDPEFEAALRAGLLQAVDDAIERGELPEWTADPLRDLVEDAPVKWLIDYLNLPD